MTNDDAGTELRVRNARFRHPRFPRRLGCSSFALSSNLALIIFLSTSGLNGQESAPPQSQPECRSLYAADSGHLWNRVHRALFVVTGSDGTEYGFDSSAGPATDGLVLLEEPRYSELLELLDEFLASSSISAVDPVKRAVFQNDLWTAFDACARFEAASAQAKRAHALQIGLARAIEKLALTAQEIKALPDNYAAAVQSGAFAKNDDPARRGEAFLPGELFDANGPWVQVAAAPEDQVTGRVHVETVSGRSGFEVYIRLPGGRQETLAYLDRLNLFPTPWKLEAAALATVFPTGQQTAGIRCNSIRGLPSFQLEPWWRWSGEWS